MSESLPQVNQRRKRKVYCQKIDKSPCLVNHPPMPRENALKEPKLYIGEWIKALDLKQSQVAKASKVKKSYLNLLCKRKRDNPSLDVLQSLADAMDLTIRDLQTPPPPKSSIEAIQQAPSGLIERIRRQRKAS